MSDILKKICDDKREHVASKKSFKSLDALENEAKKASPVRDFTGALTAASTDSYGLICEIKRGSPSKGLIRADFEPTSIAKAYKAGGAACLSVLTDIPYFMGHDDYVQHVRDVVDLPVLRKDFMIDPYQITESRALGADCILIIMAALSDTQAAEIEAEAVRHAMHVLIEVHDEKELDRALTHLKSPLIGVNNRNLKTMDVSIETSARIAKKVPADKMLVGESGIATRADLDHLANVGIRRFLIGESLMRQQDVAAATKALLLPAQG